MRNVALLFILLGLCASACGDRPGPAADPDASTPANVEPDGGPASDAAATDAPADAAAPDAQAAPRSSLPLYWTPYEYNYVHDDYIPESVWQANIDWLAANLASDGYDGIVSDGWVYGDSPVSSDGYLTKYNDAWAHDFAYWAQYCASKGLRLGVYYNPLWIQRSAYEKDGPVAGTSYSIRSIAGPLRSTKQYAKYWIDPSKPGAKEYVQGYVRHFRSIGVTFLRLDFLTEFEAAFGTAKYEEALRWIREAAGSEVFLSLVMPNGRNMAAIEVAYGDMMRVSADTFGGGWSALSDRARGVLHPDWPVAENAFDGFTHFSPVSGRGQMILDGDAIRLNTFADITERKTCISLYTMAGSPIPIADQLDTIGASKALYQNHELLALSASWFVGKPMSPTVNSADSQRWAGQTADGDWVVGLFNREGAVERRSVDYAYDLGLAGQKAGRDLWAHADLAPATSYAANLPPHDSAIVKVTAAEKRFEAEVAALAGGAKFASNHTGRSAFGFVDGLSQAGARVRFFVNSASPGPKKITVRYGNGGTIVKSASLRVNGTKVASLAMPTLASWDAWGNVETLASLSPGANEIDIAVDAGDTGGFNLDYVQID